MPYQVIYTSAETQRMRPEDLAALLEKARANNSALGVTGLLLYRNGAFLQVLEGDRLVVKDLYDTIKEDERHQGVTTLRTESVDEREFGDWSMSFRNLDGEDMTELRGAEGYSDFLDPDRTVSQLRKLSQNPSYAREVLLRFKGE